MDLGNKIKPVLESGAEFLTLECGNDVTVRNVLTPFMCAFTIA